jgi:uncharacterized membrane protein
MTAASAEAPQAEELAVPVSDSPSRSDGFVRAISAGVGGPIGRYARLGSHWWNPARVALFSATVVYLIGVVWRLPCRITAPGQSPDWFKRLCYSDIPLLYEGRGLLAGHTPYLDKGNYEVLEYPVLTGWFLEFERRLAALLGAAQGSGLGEQTKINSTLTFVDVNTVVLGLLFLVAVWAQLRTTSGRPWDAMMVATAPCIAAAALINWDLFAVALTALACMFWSRRRPGWAGLMLGLGMAAKLYPGLLLGPLFLLCLRSRRLTEFSALFGTAVISWGAVNLPVLVLAPDAWLYFWQFNSDRGGDFGSIWYVISLAGHPVPNLNLVSGGLFAAACVGIALLILMANRRPRFGQVAFLVVTAFLMTNKVYSPQYVLWLIPLLVLARPRWRDWWIFTAGELFYFVAIWWHLGGELTPGAGDQDRVYWLAVIVRLLTEGWVVIMVVRDAHRPEHDVVRASSDQPAADDPAGGVLDGAPDAAWLGAGRYAP